MPPESLHKLDGTSDVVEHAAAEQPTTARVWLSPGDIPALLGLAKSRTRADVIRAKVREAHGKEPEDAVSAPGLYAMNSLPGALDEYCLADAEDDEGAIAYNATVQHPTVPWLRAKPDALIGLDGFVMVQSNFAFRDKPAPVAFTPAAEQPAALAKMAAMAAITGRAWCDFVQWAPNGYACERVYFMNNPIWGEAFPVVEAAWAEIAAFIEEPGKLLEPKRVVIDSAEMAAVLAEYDELKIAAELAKERRDELLERIIEAAGRKDALVCGRSLTHVTKQGPIAFGKAIGELLPRTSLEKWRGKPVSFWLLK